MDGNSTPSCINDSISLPSDLGDGDSPHSSLIDRILNSQEDEEDLRYITHKNNNHDPDLNNILHATYAESSMENDPTWMEHDDGSAFVLPVQQETWGAQPDTSLSFWQQQNEQEYEMPEYADTNEGIEDTGYMNEQVQESLDPVPFETLVQDQCIEWYINNPDIITKLPLPTTHFEVPTTPTPWIDPSTLPQKWGPNNQFPFDTYVSKLLQLTKMDLPPEYLMKSILNNRSSNGIGRITSDEKYIPTPLRSITKTRFQHRKRNSSFMTIWKQLSRMKPSSATNSKTEADKCLKSLQDRFETMTLSTHQSWMTQFMDSLPDKEIWKLASKPVTKHAERGVLFLAAERLGQRAIESTDNKGRPIKLALKFRGVLDSAELEPPVFRRTEVDEFRPLPLHKRPSVRMFIDHDGDKSAMITKKDLLRPCSFDVPFTYPTIMSGEGVLDRVQNDGLLVPVELGENDLDLKDSQPFEQVFRNELERAKRSKRKLVGGDEVVKAFELHPPEIDTTANTTSANDPTASIPHLTLKIDSGKATQSLPWNLLHQLRKSAGLSAFAEPLSLDRFLIENSMNSDIPVLNGEIDSLPMPSLEAFLNRTTDKDPLRPTFASTKPVNDVYKDSSHTSKRPRMDNPDPNKDADTMRFEDFHSSNKDVEIMDINTQETIHSEDRRNNNSLLRNSDRIDAFLKLRGKSTSMKKKPDQEVTKPIEAQPTPTPTTSDPSRPRLAKIEDIPYDLTSYETQEDREHIQQNHYSALISMGMLQSDQLNTVKRLEHILNVELIENAHLNVDVLIDPTTGVLIHPLYSLSQVPIQSAAMSPIFYNENQELMAKTLSFAGHDVAKSVLMAAESLKRVSVIFQAGPNTYGDPFTPPIQSGIANLDAFVQTIQTTIPDLYIDVSYSRGPNETSQIVRAIMDERANEVEELGQSRKVWARKEWFSPIETEEQRMLLQLNVFNPYTAQILLTMASMEEVMRMPLRWLLDRFACWMPERVLEEFVQRLTEYKL